MVAGMTDEIPAAPEVPTAPTTPPPPVQEAPPTPARARTRLGDLLFGWKSAAVIFIGGLILGGLGGAGIGSLGHHHHPRGDRMSHMRGGIQGNGYGGPGGGAPVPPGMQQQPNGQSAPSSSASPKANG